MAISFESVKAHRRYYKTNTHPKKTLAKFFHLVTNIPQPAPRGQLLKRHRFRENARTVTTAGTGEKEQGAMIAADFLH
jgi:hypothetical protein